MILGLSEMGAAWRAVFYIIAVVCFIVAAFAGERTRQINAVALGLAFFVFVFAYDAVAAA